MYIYTVVIEYTGGTAFVQLLWDRITRGSGQLPMTVQLTPAQATGLKNQALAAGFIFTKITRNPVPTNEDVTGST